MKLRDLLQYSPTSMTASSIKVVENPQDLLGKGRVLRDMLTGCDFDEVSRQRDELLLSREIKALKFNEEGHAIVSLVPKKDVVTLDSILEVSKDASLKAERALMERRVSLLSAIYECITEQAKKGFNGARFSLTKRDALLWRIHIKQELHDKGFRAYSSKVDEDDYPYFVLEDDIHRKDENPTTIYIVGWDIKKGIDI